MGPVVRFFNRSEGAPSGAPERLRLAPSAEVEAHVAEIAEGLRALRIGEILTYRDILRQTNLPLERVRHRLYKAMKRVQAEGPYLFVVLRTEGVQRVAVDETPLVLEGYRGKAVRAVGRGIKIATVTGAHLKGETKRVVDAQVVGLRTLKSFARAMKLQAPAATNTVSTGPRLPTGAPIDGTDD